MVLSDSVEYLQPHANNIGVWRIIVIIVPFSNSSATVRDDSEDKVLQSCSVLIRDEKDTDVLNWPSLLLASLALRFGQTTHTLYETIARRVLFVTIGTSVLLMTTFYQTLLLSSLITNEPDMPMTLNEMATKIEMHEFNLLFYLRGSPILELFAFKSDSWE
jgi:hypothetical protein